MRREMLLLLAAGAVISCDKEITAPVPSTGSFSFDGEAGYLSASNDQLVLSRRIGIERYAVEGRTLAGDPVWQFALPPGEISGPASIDALGNIYVAAGTTTSPTASLRSLTREGALRWRTELPGLFETSPAIGGDGRVYVSSQAFGQGFTSVPAKYYGIDAATGAIVWSISSTKNASECVVDQARATVYFISSGGATAVNTATGAIRWAVFRSVGHHGGSGAIGADGTLYLTENADFSRRIDAFTPEGTLKWTFGLAPDPGGFGPFVDRDGNIYVSSGGDFSGSGPELVSLTPTGKVNWNYNELRDVGGQAVLTSDNTLYLRANAGVGEEPGLIGIRDGQVVSREAGGGSPFLDPFGRIFYAKGSEIFYFMSSGYDPNAWAEPGATPARPARLTRVSPSG